MTKNIKLIVYPVQNLEFAKTLYGKFFRVEPYTDSLYYVGYKLGDLEIGLDPNGQSAIIYVDVDDIKSAMQGLIDLGETVYQDSKDVGDGMLIAQLKDPIGNILGLRQETK